MSNHSTLILRTLFAIALFLFILSGSAHAQTTAFTYQGKLTDNNTPPAPLSGNFDFQFKLFTAASGDTQIGALTFDGTGSNPPAVAVSNGIFAVTLDFGTCSSPSPCFDGNPRFLEIAVRAHGVGSYVTLTPRQPITSTPYAMKTTNLAFNGSNNLFAGENAGTANTNGSFNVFAGASAGGANTEGSNNAFFGYEAGRFNQIGNYNSFFGARAGNTFNVGSLNTFLGANAGLNSFGVTATENTFVGAISGLANTSSRGNTMIGFGANTSFPGTLLNATAIGNRAFVTQNNSLVLGSISGVNVCSAATDCSDTNVGIGTTAPSERLHVVGNGMFTGNLTVNGTLNATLPVGSGNYIQNQNASAQAGNFNISGNGNVGGSVGIGVMNAGARLAVSIPMANPVNSGNNTAYFEALNIGPNASNIHYGANGDWYIRSAAAAGKVILQDSGGNVGIGTDMPGSRLDVAGNINTSTQYNIGGNRILSNAGTDSLFAGVDAGTVDFPGFRNSFFGSNAGKSNVNTSDNSFFGYKAGFTNRLGSNNAFFGASAGRDNFDSGGNSFFGAFAGVTNSSGNGNSFFGTGAGSGSTTASHSSFFGSNAGFGDNSGDNNSYFGAFANGPTGIPGTTNATAIGYRAFVGQNNSLVLGSISGLNGCTAMNNCDSISVGIGVSAPATKLHISGTGIVRARVNSDSNGGFQLALGEQSKWSVATVNGGQLQIFNDAIGQNAVWIDSASNNVGIGTTSLNDKLEVNGTLRVDALGTVGGTQLCRNLSNQIANCSSSLRYKTNLAPFQGGLSLIKQLRPITFNWKQGGLKDVGFGAEEVAKIDPLFVTYNDQGEVEGVKYDRLSAAFVNAFKEQQAQIEAQRQALSALRQENAEMKARIIAVEQLLQQPHPRRRPTTESLVRRR